MWMEVIASIARRSRIAAARVASPRYLPHSPSLIFDVTAVGSVIDVLGDLVALVSALGERHAVIVGGDWGATIAWQAALLRPDRFRAVAALGVPMMERAPIEPSRLFPQNDAVWFYTHYFNEPGVAERELERNVDVTLRKLYFAASGDAGPRDRTDTPNPFEMVERMGGLLDALPEPRALPAWLERADLEVLAAAFADGGFRGPLSDYRNLDRNWAQQAAFVGMHVEVPACASGGPGVAASGVLLAVAGELGRVAFDRGRYEHLVAGTQSSSTSSTRRLAARAAGVCARMSGSVSPRPTASSRSPATP